MSATEVYAITTNDPEETLELGRRIGACLGGGEVLELISDLGGGKTTLVRGVAAGIDSRDQVMSPTFTVSRIYEGERTTLHHFDFYRLSDPGIIAAELSESIEDEAVSVAIEWSDIVEDILPADRLQIRIIATGEFSRRVELTATGSTHRRIVEELR